MKSVIYSSKLILLSFTIFIQGCNKKYLPKQITYDDIEYIYTYYTNQKFDDEAFRMADKFWHSSSNLDEISNDADFCTKMLFNKSKLDIYDPLKKKAIKNQALIEYYKCKADIPDFCALLNCDNCIKSSIPLKLKETITQSMISFKNGIQNKIPISLDSINFEIAPIVDLNHHMYTEENTVFISTNLIRATFLVEFEKNIEKYYNLKKYIYDAKKVGDDINPTEAMDFFSENFIYNFFSQFHFALAHEIGHNVLKIIPNIDTEYICDCFAYNTLSNKSNLSFDFGIYKNLLIKSEKNCDFWGTGNRTKLVDRVRFFTEENNETIKKNCNYEFK